MSYRGNLGCLWIALLLLVVGGSPLLIGVLRLLLAFVVVVGVAGAAINWWLRHRAVEFYTKSQTEAHNRFVELLVALMTRMAQVDGNLDRREVSVIREFFHHRLGYRDERLLWIRDLIKDAASSQESVESLCNEFSSRFGMREGLMLLELLREVARADGEVSEPEQRFLEQVVKLLGLGAFAGAGAYAGGAGQARADHESQVDRALATLGQGRNASAEQIKTAWRNLSLENHPDRVHQLGPEFRDLAERRMKDINAAWQTLKEAGLAS